MSEDNPVIVVGAGLAGLSAAVLLGRWNLPCVVLEKHRGIAPFPRSRNNSPRSMEIFREIGVEDDIRSAAQMEYGTVSTLIADRLADEDFRRVLPVPVERPVGGCFCDQDRVEPILRRHAEKLGVQIHYDSELTGLEQTSDSVTATVRNTRTGAEHSLHGSQLIGADGAKSTIRELLGISMDGRSDLGRVVSIVFRADLSPALRGRTFMACFLKRIGGHIVTRDDDRWSLNVPCDGQDLRCPENFDETGCRDLVRLATGLPDLEIELLSARPWDNCALVADTFRLGRVFLAGDAAHVMGPWTGNGGNTGIQDVHNLCWKLAAVRSGWASRALLDTYDAERQPIATTTADLSVRRFRQIDRATGDDHTIRQIHALHHGDYRYHSDTIILEDSHNGVWSNILSWPAGEPGGPAPAIVVGTGDGRLPITDLFGREFVLLASPMATEWIAAAERLAGQLPVPLTVRCLSSPVDWTRRYGISEYGATLVRPDGFVAWRAQGVLPRPVQTLYAVLLQATAHIPAARLL